MKTLILTISVLFLFAVQLTAENAELSKLKAENDAARNKVINKYEENLKRIDLLYYKKLQVMQKEFMKKGDLDGAIAVREELGIFKDKLGITDKQPKPKPNNNNSNNNNNSKPPEKDPPEKPDNGSSNDTSGEEKFGEEEF